MPQEFLRDVVRTGDPKGRQRRWSVLPVSIVVHAVVLTAFVLSPWIVEAELPLVNGPLQNFVETVPPPPPPPPPPAPVRDVAPASTAAPREAPAEIADEKPAAPVSPGAEGGIVSGPDVVAGGSVLLGIGDRTAVVAPPPPPPPAPKLVRVGGVIREPKKLVHVAPVYPEIARLSQIEGKVTMEAVLDVTGRVESVRVLNAVPLLEDAAVRAVRQWRYTPTELNGVPVPVLMTITVVFSLGR
jgi:protein TonB